MCRRHLIIDVNLRKAVVSYFPTQRRISCWGGLAPGNNESVSKRKKVKAWYQTNADRLWANEMVIRRGNLRVVDG